MKAIIKSSESMFCMSKNTIGRLYLGLMFLLALPLAPLVGGPGEIKKMEMAGYLIIPLDDVEDSYNGGFSMYIAVWPLLEEYPGRLFQTGLPSTWMFAQHDGPKPDKIYSDIDWFYSDIEGGLGWWRDTRFATETPKFIMGGVALNFCAWANGPGAGQGRDWDEPKGKYGAVQLSPRIVWPPDGLNLKQGMCGELLGYGYLPLPLTEAKSTTAGKDVPTGNHCWTLFLNAENFKGPVTFFTPYFFSRPSVDDPRLSGQFLDSLPSESSRPIQMETQHIPSVQSMDKEGNIYSRVAPTSFPRNTKDQSVLVHQVTSYKKSALWDAVKAWFAGDNSLVPKINARESKVHRFTGDGDSSWSIRELRDGGEEVSVAWESFMRPKAYNSSTFGYQWRYQVASKKQNKDSDLVALPEYYRLLEKKDQKPKWIPVKLEDVPAETGLAEVDFSPREDTSKPYVTPDDPESCWKKPGPVAGPFKAYPGDGSVVTYYWYRFADQPAMLNADLTDKEREEVQKRVEKIHKNWKMDQEYLPAPKAGKLAAIDPALIVNPPKGFEIGYVPIATRQEAGKK
jgi:hypothetical protein